MYMYAYIYIYISAAGAPAMVAARMYNERALSTFSYIARLALPPEHLQHAERTLLGHLLHLPPQALSGNDFFALAQWSNITIKSMLATSVAVIIRSVLVTLKTWRSMHDMLTRSSWDLLPLIDAKRGIFQPRFWRSKSLAQTLHEAAHGFP